ncbi:MAG: hypothetical protein GX334_00745 [Firmicutes bacterium]|nr:hypothetical protein [Bacillota bacterium]
MEIPDVTAYCLEEAGKILTDKGIKFCLKETVPPFISRFMQEKEQLGTAKCRVLKQTRLADGMLELTIAKEVT